MLRRLLPSVRSGVVKTFRCTPSMSEKSLSRIAHDLAERGLVVSHSYDDFQLHIGRHSSAQGTEFLHASEDRVIGVGDATFLTNAPIATIRRKRRPIRWVADISIPAAPGPGPVFFNETFDTAELAAEAILECYFGDRIDFNNESLAQWYP